MEDITRKLNFLLANLQVQRANLQAVHWNLRGCHSFLTFHGYFGGLYDANTGHIDMIAELVRIHRGSPFISFSRYLRRATISEVSERESMDIEAALNKAFRDNLDIMGQIKDLFDSTATNAPDINDYMALMSGDYGKRQWFLTSSMSSSVPAVPKMEEKEEEEEVED